MPMLVTGAAGFIGFHSAMRLLDAGREVVGLDNLNAYYDPQLKLDRLAELKKSPRFIFVNADVSDRAAVNEIFVQHKFREVIHLAAQAGVRYSLDNPFAYTESNISGLLVILECCREWNVRHLVYASSSSVYGANTKRPFSVSDRTDNPISLYAATKKANELMCHTYSHLFGIPCTGLRFFTVYGPWGRPDMAYYKFAAALMGGRPIDVYNHGQMLRDFTYISDIVDGILAVAEQPPVGADDGVPHRIYNLGNNRPEPLMELIRLLENNLGVEARLNFLPMQPGDVEATCADIDSSRADFGFSPKTSLADGVGRFCEWYLGRLVPRVSSS